MSNLKQKHKDYLIKNEIKDLTDLVNYVEILRNTSNLKGEDRQMLFDFAFLITNEQLSLKSFFAENKNPSKEFYNAFKTLTEIEDKSKWIRANFYTYSETNEPIIQVCGFISIEDAKNYFSTSQNTEAFYYTYGTDELIEKEEKSKSFPTFMDEVINNLQEDKIEMRKFQEQKTETSTEAPDFKECLGVQMREGKIFTYKLKEEIGKKETEGKLNYELDWEFIQQLAERMSQNKGKYKPYNWMQPIDVEKLKQSLFRHVVEVMKGNYEDDGRTFGHLESISANVMMINYQLKNKS
jgi:hypothetical protein